MKKIIHRADSRGYFDHGWLKTSHSFSFGHWQNPRRMNFGMLRVLNDDIVAPGQGFGKHPHDNMEIVSIPLQGTLAHQDSAGHEETIKPGEVQVMSAGTGIWHSEYNHSANEPVHFLQIWVMPNGRGHEPRYDQLVFDLRKRLNKIQTIVAPEKTDDALWLNQKAYFSWTELGAGHSHEYRLHGAEMGVYVFLIEGEIEIAHETLHKRDAIGIWSGEAIGFTARKSAFVLLIEVPMP